MNNLLLPLSYENGATMSVSQADAGLTPVMGGWVQQPILVSAIKWGTWGWNRDARPPLAKQF